MHSPHLPCTFFTALYVFLLLLGMCSCCAQLWTSTCASSFLKMCHSSRWIGTDGVLIIFINDTSSILPAACIIACKHHMFAQLLFMFTSPVACKRRSLTHIFYLGHYGFDLLWDLMCRASSVSKRGFRNAHVHFINYGFEQKKHLYTIHFWLVVLICLPMCRASSAIFSQVLCSLPLTTSS